jgi:acetyltransferase-like isoleucine patch superfamily enzyme
MKIRSVYQLPGLLWQALWEGLGERKLRSQLVRQHEGLGLGKRVEIRSPERLYLGKNVTIDSGALLHCGGMDWCDGAGGISIGDNSSIGPGCVLFGAGGIEIGNNVMISPGVVLASHQHTFAQSELAIREQPAEFAPIIIKDNVYVGCHATILPGVVIETGSVIGAGSVVTKDVSARSLCFGIPAHRVRGI